MRARGLALAGAAWLLAIGTASAQAPAQPVPGTVQPGQIERQFQAPPEPRAQTPAVEVPSPQQGRPPEAEKVRFTLKSLFVDGVTVYPDEALRATYEPYLNREIALGNLYGIADALTAKYRNDGYILSQVVVPAQAIEDGAVRLQAVEGFVDQVRLEGDIEGRRGLVDGYATKLKDTRPLRADALERYLLLMNDLSGVTARATLVPSPTQPGASDLVVQITHRKVSGGVSIDNRGSKAIGPLRLTADLDLQSVFSAYERTGLKFGVAPNSELRYVSLAHDQPVGDEGGRLGLSLSVVRSQPEVTQGLPVTLETSSEAASLSYTHPVVRSRSRNLYVRAALTGHDGRTDINGIRNSEDRIRALRLGLTYDRADELRGINLLDLEFSQGIDGLGATRSGSPNLSRANGRSDFTKLTAYAARLQSIASRWSVLGAVSAQYAFSDLLAPELFGFGGEQFGRGYDPSEIVGDSGAGLKLELRYTAPVASEALTGYTAYGFYDVGTVRQRTPANQQASESASSAGLGLRFSLGRHVSGYFELAKPLTRVVTAEGDRDVRGYFGLSARY